MDLLSLATPAPELDDAARRVARATADLGRSASTGARIATRHFILLARAALASGDFTAGERALRSLAAAQLPSGALPRHLIFAGTADAENAEAAETDELATALFVLLAAGRLDTDGDFAAAAGCWPHVARALRYRADHGGTTADRQLDTAVRVAASRVAEAIGREPATPRAGATLVGLDADGPTDAAALIVARALPDRGPPPPPADAPPPAAQQPAAQQRGIAAAALLLGFLHGELGVEADAARNRLRLAPRLPAGWTRLRVASLPVGDARINLAYDRDADRHVFRLAQESGGIPLLLVFEPAIEARRLAAMIDGTPADLDFRVTGSRIAAPVQLSLDAERMIELIAHEA